MKGWIVHIHPPGEDEQTLRFDASESAMFSLSLEQNFGHDPEVDVIVEWVGWDH